MNLSSVITNLGATNYTVTRLASNGYTDGRRNAPTSSTLTILAMVQPVTGRELDRMPEGLQDKEVRAVWTVADLKVTVAGGEHEPDVITIDGFAYQVQSVDDWSTLGSYRRYIAAKV